MYTIINKIKLITTDYKLQDGKESLCFEISRPIPYSKEIMVACKLPCFNHNIGHFQSVSQAEEAIKNYYNENYENLIQLKQLGYLRCELIKKIKNQEILDLLPVISECITTTKFPLVDNKYIRDTECALFGAISSTQSVS